MLSDVLYINDTQRNSAKDIYDIVEKTRNNQRFVIAIGGESGCGKTVLAYCICYEYKLHKLKSKPLHTDNYYLVLPEIRTQWRREHGLSSIGANEYDWKTLNNNISSFYKGNIAYNMPCVELLTDTVDKLTTDFQNINILVVEGLYALKVENADIRIYIDIPFQETTKAQIMRGKEPQTPFRTSVLQREHEEVTQTKPLADIIIDRQWHIVK